MLKFLIILGLILYLVYKVAGFFFKTLFFSAQQRSQEQSQHQRSNYSKPRAGNLNIDYIPKKGEKPPKDFKGGDYVDFEEVK